MDSGMISEERINHLYVSKPTFHSFARAIESDSRKVVEQEIAELEALVTAENQRKQQLEHDLSAAKQEIARLKMYEPGNRAKPMDKPVQVAATKLSYWGIIDKEEAEA